jgi:glycerol-3-phosphate acyltransferase PlsY
LSAVLVVTAYLLGSIPCGAIIARRWGGVNVQRGGSRNIGATNVARLAGWQAGVLTLLADAAKGAVPVGIWLALTGSHGWPADALACLVAAAAFSGHLWPLYTLGRGGGKGVATALGIFMLLEPLACLAALTVFLAAAGLSRRASVGSLAASAALPLAIGCSRGPLPHLVLALVVMACILWRHAGNIVRLAQGREPVFRAAGRAAPDGGGS